MTAEHEGAPLPSVPAPRADGCPFGPPPLYERLQAERPVGKVVIQDGTEPWLLTRYDDVRQVLGDPRFSSDATRPGFPFLSSGVKALTGNAPIFIRMDDPEHQRLRRMLTGDFTARQIERLRPRIQEIADDFVDKLLAGPAPADLVAQYAQPIPSLVICLMLGVPYQDTAFFQERSQTLLDNDSAPEDIGKAHRDLLDYLRELTDAKAARPDDGIISKLVARGELGRDEIAAMGQILLIAGHESTANSIALSVLALLRHPEELARLRDDPSLITGASDELLRFVTTGQLGVPRVALEDVEIGGESIRAGDGVVSMISTANRDEAKFPDATTLDVTRDARRHVAFGFGTHQCLGQPLARVELQIAVATLLRRMPDLRLAVPFDEVKYRSSATLYGIAELPVEW
ncbi:MAG: cytochrome P450 [Streptomycetaceae bacterium]|nr:cytochrome P450 [Streptomycetaceae bacterium]